MSPHRLSYWAAVGLAVIPFLWGTAIFPGLHLCFFGPFLAVALYKKRAVTFVWTALACGLALDLLADHDRLGIHAVAYVLAAVVLVYQRKRIFGDEVSTLPLMTMIFSAVATAGELVLLRFFGNLPPLSIGALLTDLVAMPLADGLYALAWFTLPSFLYDRWKTRKRSDGPAKAEA